MKRVVLLLSLATSGCSFLMMNNPRPGEAPPRCESARVIPVIDAIGAVASVVVGAAILRETAAEGGPGGAQLAVIGASAGLGATFTVGSVVGFGRASRCRQAKASDQVAAP